MRVHRLELTAFGPYAGTEVLDFEALNEAGLFLLTGPTGAGKTTILDAVCFAVYGVVPGERGTRELRSDHAPVDRRPEVVLDVTIGDRRYRIRRSPEWRRPKRRGSGETKENACATLLELAADGSERLVSSRIAEVGHELQLAMGMSSEQFLQVALLPQGGFQTFLQASSDERQSVLQKLFHTHRFARIEDWMRDRTRVAKGDCAGAEREVTQLLATLAHRSGSPLPPQLSEERLGEVGTVARDWAAERLESARRARAAAQLRHQQACTAESRARACDERVAQLVRAAETAAAARAVLARLDATAEHAAADQERLGAHERARLVAPLLTCLPELRHRTGTAADRSNKLVAAAVSRLDGLPPALSVTVDEPPGPQPVSGHGSDTDSSARDRRRLVRARRLLDERLGRLRALLPREEERLRLVAEQHQVERHLGQARARLAEVRALGDGLPARREALVAELAELRPLARGLDPARVAAEHAARCRDSAAALPTAVESRDRAREAWQEARESAVQAREHHLDVVERRLAGIAAELAGQLAAGGACQVCGSTEHPRPATAALGAVTEAEQEQALRRQEAAQLAADLAGEAHRAAESVVQELWAGAGGGDLAECSRQVARCREQLAACEVAARRLPAAEAALRALEEEESALAEEQRRADDDCRRHESQALAIQATLAATTAELIEATADLTADLTADPTDDVPAGRSAGRWLAALVERLDDASTAASVALAAVDDHDALTDRLDEAQEGAVAAAEAQGFATLTAVGSALLSEAAAAQLVAEGRAREAERRSAEAALTALPVPPAPDLPDAPWPDLEDPTSAREVSRAALATASSTTAACGAEVGAAEAREGDLRALVEALECALTAWEPLRSQLAVTESLSSLVRGMSADNQLQMRLSSYVLATRLDQVLAAANERLLLMRDQRYSIRRCGQRSGPGRAGLGLEVVDAWTGEARRPATLSGGETFVVSLALALGLADVVAEESGGLSVGTLFVDEGFGMLDPDTLDDVMDRIDSLRAGGRTVGVVSHVSELRARIPTQVHVRAGRDGSTIEVRSPDLAPA